MARAAGSQRPVCSQKPVPSLDVKMTSMGMVVRFLTVFHRQCKASADTLRQYLWAGQLSCIVMLLVFKPLCTRQPDSMSNQCDWPGCLWAYSS